MDSGVLSQVLAALAQGAAGQAGQHAWTALAALAGRILGHDSAEAKAIEAARAGNADPGRPGGLAEILARRASTDPGFAAGLEDWLAGTRELLEAGHATVNQVTGQQSGTVIQAGNVFGGIRIGDSPGPAA
jgi:hypothetical protein